MKALFFAILLGMLLGPLAQAGTILGRVMNAQGTPIPEARVLLEEDGNRTFRREILTQADGSYELGDLDAGVYLLTVTGPSGEPVAHRDVVVGTPESSVRLNIRFPAQVEPVAAFQEEGNPSRYVVPLDGNALRARLTVVRGPDPQYISEFLPEKSYFGAEFGAPVREVAPLIQRPVASLWSSSVSESLVTNLFNARPFFQVGPLQPSRANRYEVASGGPLLAGKLSLFAQWGRLHDSGEVNGNVQAPKEDERLPRSRDPRSNQIVSFLLQAYGAGLPNLPQVSERQRNANASQRIDSKNGMARLDFRAGEGDFVALRYSIEDFLEDPFDLVIGQHPQTDLRDQAAHLSWTHTFSPQAVARAGFVVNRARTSLEPSRQYLSLFDSLETGAAVPDVEFVGDTLQDLGPGKQYPRYRVQSRFQLYTDASKIAGRHAWKVGWGITRSQVNDLQSDNARGTLLYQADFGHSEVENFLLGNPSQWTITLGKLYRGFRTWEHHLYVGDQIRLKPTLTLSLGLRYELETAPTEVNGLTQVGYATDATNLAPRFGLAWNPRRGRTTLRAGYGISYGSVFPATYQFARFNPPVVRVLQIPAPDLSSLPSLTAPAGGGVERTALSLLSRDLVTPYSHHYTAAVERTLGGSFFLRVAYIGMRSFHLFTQNVYNRARPVPGIPLTTGTIDERRPDPRYHDVRQIESNSIAYYDAGQVTFEKRLSRGLAFRSTYTFSKNLDLGGDFTNTASGVEEGGQAGIPQSELTSRVGDLKGWSLLDTPHAWTASFSYALPPAGHLTGWRALLLRDWEFSGTTVFQSGLPFPVYTADSPGYGNVDGVGHDRPNLLHPAILGRSADNPDAARTLLRHDDFDTMIPPGGRGNIGFGVFRKDGGNNCDLSIAKTLRFRRGRELSLQIRASFRNFFNHPQFAAPEANVTSTSFGRITSTVNTGRVSQILIRASF